MKVAVVGAGSIGFTRSIVRDLLGVPEFRDDIQFSFTDISKRNLDMVTRLVRRDMEANGVKATLRATTDRRRAFKDADYVFCVVRVGGLDAFQLDVDIPLKYGVDQCVGDTLCAGGIMYAQRTIPVLLEFLKDVREVAAPGCRFISHSNPMSMNTWACNEYGGGVPVIGLCHGVEGGHRLIARAFDLPPEEVDIVCAGLNHRTWYIQIKHNGEDLTGKLLRKLENHPVYSKTEKVRIDVLRRFGYFSTESNGHLSEYLPWYRKRPRELKKWISLGTSWIHGETGGYLRVCTEGRRWFETDFPNWMKQPPMEYGPDKRGAEHGSYIVEGLETGRLYRGHFNVRNKGCITNLPEDCCVEVPGYVDANGVNIPIVGDLPLGPAALLQHSVAVERLAVEAAVSGDDALLRQAMLMDPLTGAVCNPPEIAQMVDEMLAAQARWLPQYQKAVRAARRRLRKAKSDGTLIKTKEGYKGAARLHTKSVSELRKHKEAARKQAAAADKAEDQPPARKKTRARRTK
jgi:alpha-galactosidase